MPSTADLENFHRLVRMIEQDGKLGWTHQEVKKLKRNILLNEMCIRRIEGVFFLVKLNIISEHFTHVYINRSQRSISYDSNPNDSNFDYLSEKKSIIQKFDKRKMISDCLQLVDVLRKAHLWFSCPRLLESTN